MDRRDFVAELKGVSIFKRSRGRLVNGIRGDGRGVDEGGSKVNKFKEI